jgi:hypothetical protein
MRLAARPCAFARFNSRTGRVTTADPGAEICVGCGMCCDGTLYEHAKVSPGEEARMEAAGLELFETGGKTVFREPCPHSTCGRCAIYETRFRICRTYECALLQRVRAGQCSVAEAQGKIAMARELLAGIEPDAKTAVGRKRTRARLSSELRSSGGKDGVAQRLLDIVALDTFLERWFRLEREMKLGKDLDRATKARTC